MVEYNKVNVKLSNTQLKKLKDAVKDNTGTTLRISLKMFDITATPNNAATQIVFKNCAPFEKCRTEINETFIDETDFINITMPMYNLTEYSDNYSDTSGSLRQFKTDD